MAKKVPFYVVVQKIQLGKLTEQEFKDYFVVEANPDKPLDFRIGINAEHVDISNIEGAAALAEPLARHVWDIHARRQQQAGAKSLKRSAGRRQFGAADSLRYKRRSPIIADGDSWFKLPQFIMPPTLIDILQRNGSHNIINMARWGETLDDVIRAGEFWPFFEARHASRADTLMLSAGGNDMIGGGNLEIYLELFDHEHAKPSDAPYYIKPEFYQHLDHVLQNYEGIVRMMKSKNENAFVIGHGYDYAIPTPEGPWIGAPMMRRGLDPHFRKELCRGIVKIMVDQWNMRLESLQAKFPNNYRYVNLRGTVLEGEWADELHPRESGVVKTAAKFAVALNALPASAQVAMPRFERPIGMALAFR